MKKVLTAILISAAGLATAAPSSATPDQDYLYFSLLEDNGLHVTVPSKAKNLAYAICDDLGNGRPWRLIISDIMSGADWTLNDASTLFGAATLSYCPSLIPAEIRPRGLTT